MTRCHALDHLQLETPRLLLRVPRAEDLDAWSELMADPVAAKFIGGAAPRAMTWRGMMTTIGAWHGHGFGMFSVVEKASGRWVGRLGPWMPDGWPGPEIGWAISRHCWGRGYATEGAVAAIDWAFDNLGWTEVIHTIAPDNTASQQVARKLGSALRGPGRLPAPFAEDGVEIWGQTFAQWSANAAARTRAIRPEPSR